MHTIGAAMAEDTLFYKTMTTGQNWATNIGSGINVEYLNGKSGFINLPKAYAALNRKNMRHTDNKGYALAYVVEVEAIGNTSNAQELEIFTAPENWVLKNAVRKWHIARNAMLERNGVLGQVGEYHRTIRPYLTVAHARIQGDASPDLYQPNYETTYSSMTEATDGAIEKTSLVGGEWTYTRVASEASYDDAEGGGTMSNAGPPVDTYALVLTGDHDSDDGTSASSMQHFTHVSMMRSYLESRRNASSIIQDSSGGGTVAKEPNPLADLMVDSLSGTEAREIIQDHQREKPPYDTFGTSDTNALAGNDALDLISKCHLLTSTSYPKDKEVIRVPMGLMHVRATATGGDTPSLRIRLLGIDKCQG
jgi:hypothetical protein